MADTNLEIRSQGDQNGDGWGGYPLAEQDPPARSTFWQMAGGPPISGNLRSRRSTSAYDIVGTGDYNGDGKSDLLWRHATNGEVWDTG